MIKAVIFDFGGVLLRTHDWSGRQQWEQRLQLAPYQSEWVVFNSPLGRQAQHGQLTYADLWQQIGRQFDLSAADLAQFQQDFWAGDQLDTALVGLIRQLQPWYKTGLISNAFDDLRQTLNHSFAIADAFDSIVVSAEEGIMKPDPAIYHTAVQQLGCQPAEAVFIDDAPANLEGATAVGMAAIQFTPHIDLVAELAKVGVHIPH